MVCPRAAELSGIVEVPAGPISLVKGGVRGAVIVEHILCVKTFTKSKHIYHLVARFF